MVQRKVPNKLGIQADHVKSEKRLVNLKSSSSQQQDGKNRGGPDLKKKMKKSRSIKRSDFESLRSPNMRREVPQPGKPPPVDVSTSAAIPQKQSPIKASDVSPNYMKSTSCFDARKERSQVSNRNSQTSSDSKSRKNSNTTKVSSASGHKPARTLTRTSSLKAVRTLTKTPSFKPARASTKKCSPVVLCEDLNVQRATCSSTLKDSKFPSYLTLSPGRTESEGTSVLKVCPYTYCSLNSHHHPPLPPLKCFVSARRRMLKFQKSIKLGCLSPRRARPSGDSMKELDIGQVIFDDEPPIQELELDSSAIAPLIEEEHADFFIEIYSKEREDDADTVSGSKHNGDDIMPSVGGNDETAAEHHDVQVVESLSDETPCSEIDFEDNLNQNSDVISTEMDIAGFFPEEDQNVEVAEEVYPPSLAEEGTTLECLGNQQDLEAESPPSIQPDEPDSEASDMEWEAEQYPAPYFDEVDNSIQTNNESDLERGYSSEVESHTFRDESIFKSDDVVGSCFEEILADEVMQESLDEESVSSEAWFVNGDSESDCSDQNMESDESHYIQVSDKQSHDQLSPTYDAFEESTTTEVDGDTKSDDLVDTEITSVPVEEPIEEPGVASEDKKGISEADNEIPRIDFQLGDDKNECTISIEHEALIDNQENKGDGDNKSNYLVDTDITSVPVEEPIEEQRAGSEDNEGVSKADNEIPRMDFQLGDDISECTNSIEDEALIDHEENESLQHDNVSALLGNQESDYLHKSDDVTERNRSSEEVFDGSLVSKTEDSETDQNCLEQELPIADAGEGMEEKEQVDTAKSLVGIQTSDSLQGSSEADQDMISEDHDTRQLGAITKDNKSSQTFADEGLPAETQDDSSDEQAQNNNIVENQNHSEKDCNEAENFKASNSMDSEDQTHSGTTRLSLAETRDQEVHEMEVECTTKSDAEDTRPTANVTSSTETENALFHAGSSLNQELPMTCKNPRGTIRCKRPIEEEEEPGKFNPREPNYLPVEPDPEAEKVDLRHQMMDERRNSEEWMLDYALRQAVTKLAPARKRKVALLVEAFETVMPIPKYESHLQHNSATFAHARPIQACS